MTLDSNSPSSFVAYRFSPWFLIYSRLSTLPCVTWSQSRSKLKELISYHLHSQKQWNFCFKTRRQQRLRSNINTTD
jgi:hypothetical protein